MQSRSALLFATNGNELALMCCQASATEQGRGGEGSAVPMTAGGRRPRGQQHMFQEHGAVGEESWPLPCPVKPEAACYLRPDTHAIKAGQALRRLNR